MDIGNNIAKVVDGRLDAGSAAEYFRAATLGGARALGRTDLGRLTPGAQADLIVLGLGEPHIGVVDDPVRTILMNGSARDVQMTVVAGRTVMSKGVVPGVETRGFNGEKGTRFVRANARFIPWNATISGGAGRSCSRLLSVVASVPRAVTIANNQG